MLLGISTEQAETFSTSGVLESVETLRGSRVSADTPC